MMLTHDQSTWSDQLRSDDVGALFTAFCGRAVPPTAARALAGTIATTLASLQRVP